jgi:hypothetical protein
MLDNFCCGGAYHILQQKLSLSPKILGLAVDPQQTNQGRLHVFFSVILFYPKSYPL